jgi:putative sterol carrier protein
MVCVPRHDVLVHYLGPELCQRAAAAEIAMPIEIGLAIDDCHYQLSLYGRRAKLTSGKIGENNLVCSRKTWVRLLLGSVDASSALLAEKLTASTSSARRYAEVLFPAVPLWHSPWADLPIG